MDNSDIIASRSTLDDGKKLISELISDKNGKLTKKEVTDRKNSVSQFRGYVFNYLEALYNVEATDEVTAEIIRIQKLDSTIFSRRDRTHQRLRSLNEIVEQF